jgi:hypothetical protein
MIHHEDVNMALALCWSEKLYMSGVPVAPAPSSSLSSSSSSSRGDDAGDSDGRIWKKKNGQPTNDDN